MQTFKLLSGLAILNLLSVGIIANFTKPFQAQAVNGISIIAQTAKPTPTPIIVIKKVVTKVYRTAKPASAQKSGTNQNTTTNQTVTNIPSTNAPTNSQPVPQAPTQVPAPQVAQCVVIIDGVNYDVTNFRFSHSGGNIFNCGTDMSSTFWSRHNAGILNQMQKYRI